MKKDRKKKTEEAVAETTTPEALSIPADFTPLTKHQSDALDAFERSCNMVLAGAAGAGKTYVALSLALRYLAANHFKKKLIIVRSVVPTRDMGFLPGTQAEKEAAYQTPYIGVVNEIFGSSTAYSTLVKSGVLKFMTTSYIRGITINDAVVVVDEFQNCNFHELDSIITRMGKNARILFCGDTLQSDFTSERERQSVFKFLEIIDKLKYFKRIDFTWEDCVRSSLVRDYLMTKEMITHEQKT